MQTQSPLISHFETSIYTGPADILAAVKQLLPDYPGLVDDVIVQAMLGSQIPIRGLDQLSVIKRSSDSAIRYEFDTTIYRIHRTNFIECLDRDTAE